MTSRSAYYPEKVQPLVAFADHYRKVSAELTAVRNTIAELNSGVTLPIGLYFDRYDMERPIDLGACMTPILRPMIELYERKLADEVRSMENAVAVLSHVPGFDISTSTLGNF